MKPSIGVAGAGTMGSGIAQVAAQSGHEVVLYDAFPQALEKGKKALEAILNRLQEKGKLGERLAAEILAQINFTSSLADFARCGLVIEAVIEDLSVKQKLFRELENICEPTCILATNTSSLSVASIAASVQDPSRVIGIHFFNPAPLMPLVEIIPAIRTSQETTSKCRELLLDWNKLPVITKDTPGFIVNRVARPFYGEALRIYEEGIASIPEIDAAMKSSGFKMGPFELMDYIGNDINYTVTETVFREFFYDQRYKPSFTQKRMMEAGLLGRKTGKGYYDYAEGATRETATPDNALSENIVNRILAMLINEAADALYLNIASREDIDLAMTKGVNYPKGLLKWADELGVKKVLSILDDLYGTIAKTVTGQAYFFAKWPPAVQVFIKKPMLPFEIAKKVVDLMYNGDPFSQWMGIRIDSVEPGKVQLSMIVKEEMLNGFGIAHGGISYSLADSSLAFASNSHGRKCVSVETSISHTRPVKAGDELLALCEEKHLGNKTAIYETTVSNQRGELVAIFKGTVYRTSKNWIE